VKRGCKTALKGLVVCSKTRRLLTFELLLRVLMVKNISSEKSLLKTHRRRKKKTSFSTRQGLLLILGIGTFVALVFILAYYIWYLPIEKSMQ
jgi:magnesium-transporting ATPase (P-type)